MSKNKHMENLYDTADKFINLANILVQEDNSGTVGSGMRFASARFSAFEISTSGRDLVKEKDALIEELLADYKLMLEENFHVYIHHQHQEIQKSQKIKHHKTDLKIHI